MGETKNIDALGVVKVALGVVFASVLLPSNLKAIAIAFLGLSVLFLSFRRKWHFNRSFFLFGALYYLLLVITLLYSEDIAYGTRKLSTMASAAVFPLIFALLKKSEVKRIFKSYTTYLWIYIISVLLFNLVPFIYFFVINYSFGEMLIHFPTVIKVDMGKFNIHPIYMSVHCSVAILFSFYVLKKIRSKRLITALLSIDVALVLFLLLYAKKGPLIALVVIFSLFVAFQRNNKLLKPYIFAVIAFIVLIIAVPNTRNRFIELIEIGSITEEETTSTNIRYTIYQAANALISESVITGYGVGDYNEVLKKEYKERGLELLYNDEYNAHNQYLSFMLMGGILVLLAFLFFLGIILVYAIRYNNQLLILLLVFYSIVLMTENLLEREAGIIYFSFFVSFFALMSTAKHDQLTSGVNN